MMPFTKRLEFAKKIDQYIEDHNLPYDSFGMLIAYKVLNADNKNGQEEFKSFLRDIKHNRDYYSRAKIIEMIEDKFDKLYKLQQIKIKIKD